MRFTSPENSYILFLGIYPGSHENIYSDKDFYMNIHSTLFITVKLETKIHQQVNEKIICYTHTMEYYLAIKRTIDTCNSMDESRNHYSKGKEPENRLDPEQFYSCKNRTAHEGRVE